MSYKILLFIVCHLGNFEVTYRRPFIKSACPIIYVSVISNIPVESPFTSVLCPYDGYIDEISLLIFFESLFTYRHKTSADSPFIRSHLIEVLFPPM